MNRPVEAVINLTNIRKNLALAKKAAVDARVMVVVKANAYGHGAEAVANALSNTDAFGVASLTEAVELRESGVVKPVVLLGGVFAPCEWQDVEHYDLQVVIHNQQQLDSFLATKFADAKQIVVWLKMDTGMHRLGFSPQAFGPARHALIKSGKVHELILMSHFACADELDNGMTERQLAVFNQVVEQEKSAEVAKAVAEFKVSISLANSAAVMYHPNTHYDWVRPGIMLYGANPLGNSTVVESDLAPVMTLRSRLIEIRDVGAGESVGYGQQWRSENGARIGVVAVGYGDGYPRHARNGTPVLVAGKRAALVGRVSMDYIAVDLSDLLTASVGDDVVLWGEGLPVEEVAAMAGTIAYELLTGVQSRVVYRYVY